MSYSINTVTPNFIVYSDSPLPIMPSNVSYTPLITTPYTPYTTYTPYVGPVGATVVIPGPVTLPRFLDLNNDSRVRNQVTKYFRYKTLDKWLYEDMSNLLGYFVVSPSGVQLVKNMSDYKDSVVSQMNPDDVDKIVNWIEHYLLTEDTMKKILNHFVKETKANWYDLHKNEYFIKEIIQKKLLSIIRDTITEKKK
jgi:hypothetical protein